MTTLVSIDTTPNPNSLKLNIGEAWPQSATYTTDNEATAPKIVQTLLHIEGIESIFASANFLTLNRHPKADWEVILKAVHAAFDENESKSESPENSSQVQVWVQTFREIPIQVKVTQGIHEKRVGLPERFGSLARELQKHCGADYLKERHWADYGSRYGSVEEIAQEISDEIESLHDEATLQQRAMAILGESPATNAIQTASEVTEHPAWHARLKTIQETIASEETASFLMEALQDEQPQIRRWAAAKLAGIKTSESVKALSESLLNDPNVGVRRTAGDSLSDIADVSAQEAICQALQDKNKLVRWRAARFLAEVGTELALPSLDNAKNDAEYEVRMEIEAAIRHIQEGASATLPVWKLMAQNQP
jgi:Virulence factor/Scaffold protein Nfu/NifU N terminal/HEAT repeats